MSVEVTPRRFDKELARFNERDRSDVRMQIVALGLHRDVYFTDDQGTIVTSPMKAAELSARECTRGEK